MDTRTQPYSYEHLQEIELADLEINKVTTDASLSMVTSPTAEKIESVKL